MTELARPSEEVYEADVSAIEAEFDATMGALEEILMSEQFSGLQTSFCLEHSSKFSDDVEENKHEYFDIFQSYSQTMEKFIVDALTKNIDNFSMQSFTTMLISRKDEFPGDVLDLLMGLSDFVEFKQMMIAFKAGEKLDFVLSSTATEHDFSSHK